MVHAGTIGVKGRAPSELDWRRPTLMENVLRRYSGGTPGLDGDFVREPRLVYGKIELNLERVPDAVH
jgi:hypothetical protein